MPFYPHLHLSLCEALRLLLLHLTICSWCNPFSVITATIHLGHQSC